MALNNTTGFNDHGSKVLTLEMLPEAWMRIHPILSHMHVMVTLKKLLGKRAYASQIESGKQIVGSIIKEQGNKRAQMEYCNQLNYVSIPEIVTLEKRVEMHR